MSQRMGRAAEDAFKLLCSRAKITCNRSAEDDFGWDFIVEIPLRPRTRMPLDKRPGAVPAFVQVKSTGDSERTITMKVSNARQLARKPAPCFMVLFHDAGSGERVYARLFGKADTERTLRRARELYIEGREENKAEITFRFPDEEEHSVDLVEWMAECVEGLGEGYAAEKIQLVETVGYGKGNFKATFTFAGSRGLDDLVDLLLGVKDQLEVSHYTLSDLRFGLEAPEPMADEEGPAVLRRQREQDGVECVVQLECGEDVATVPSRAKTAVVPALGSSRQQIGFAARNDLFTLVVRANGTNEMGLKFHGNWSTQRPLAELEQLARILSWHDRDLRVRVSGNVPGIEFPELDVRVAFAENPMPMDREVADIVATLRRTAERCSEPDVLVALDELFRAGPDLGLYHGVLSEGPMSLDAGPIKPELDAAMLRNLLGFVEAEVGGIVFLAVFDAAIQAKVDTRGYLTINVGSRNIRDCVVGHSREAVRAQGRELYGRAAAGYGDDWIATDSLNELVKSGGQRS